jgi:hypothetical protein
MLQDFRLLTEQSLWFIVPAVIAGLSYAFLLYYSSAKKAFSPRANLLLFIFRFLVVTLIAGLLLGPFFRQSKRSIQQPVIVFLHDNSVSMAAHDSSGSFAEDYWKRINVLATGVSDRMQLNHFVFGKQLVPDRQPDFTDERTDIAEALRQLPGLFYRRNVGAVLLITDGIYNSGVDPLLPASELPFPVYTIGMGDTTSYPDLSITDVRYNRVVWANSEFPVEVSLLARDAEGSKIDVSLWMDGKIIGQKTVVAGSASAEGIAVFNVKDAMPGQRRLVVQLSGLDNERITSNNRREFFVEVMGQKQRILLLAAAPHPDLGALQSAVADYYDCKVEYINSWTESGNAPDLLILHELPLAGSNFEAIARLIQSNPSMPVWFIAGVRTDAVAFNRLQEVYRMRPFSQSAVVDAFALPERTFGLFKTDETYLDRIVRMPALNAQLSDWEVLSPAIPLLRQRLRGVETAYPLWSFYESSGRRMAFLAGTGLWRWRLADHQRNGSSDAVNDIIRKTVNYLIIRADDRRLRLFTENIFSRNDEISFRAELYNQSMELVNEPELLMTIWGEEVKYDYAFYRTDNNDYRLNIGRLPPGDYRYKAEAVLAGEQISREGQFSVSSDSPELRNLQANHRLLRSISALTGGTFLPANQLENLEGLLNNDNRITSTASYSLLFSPVLGQLWALILLLFLLSAEWLIRRYLGAY